MNVDIERLKTDPDYWDEVAPDGAEIATCGPSILFHKWVGGMEYVACHGSPWAQSLLPWPRDRYQGEDRPDVIARPRKYLALVPLDEPAPAKEKWYQPAKKKRVPFTFGGE